MHLLYIYSGDGIGKKQIKIKKRTRCFRGLYHHFGDKIKYINHHKNFFINFNPKTK